MNRWSVIKMLVPWFLLFAVTSCGSLNMTGGNNDFAGGGIGGTGISVGKITAAVDSSVSVNGVAFDTTNTSVTIDGVTGHRNNLKVGMIVKVDGTFNEDGVTGVAASIKFKDNLEGPVESVDVATNSIVVLGQTVNLNSKTYFDGFSDISGDSFVDVNDIIAGNVVEISGLTDANGIIHASYISLKSVTFEDYVQEVELKGTITNLDTNAMTFTIGDLTVEYNINTVFKHISADALIDGLFVEVKSVSAPVNNVLIASTIELEDEGHGADEGKRIELEGYVTDVTDLADDKFELEGQIVQITADTIFKAGSGRIDIVLNAKVEVEGAIDAYGMLVAHEIKIEAADDGSGEDHGSNDSGNTGDEVSGE